MVQGSKPATLVTVLLAALLGIGFLQAPAANATPSATARALSASANPTGATKGKAVTFSGTLTKSPKGSVVTVQRKVGKKWVAAKSTKTTSAAGRYAVRVVVPPKVGTYAYRAVAPAKGSLRAATSKVVKVSTLTPVVATLKATPKPPAAATAGGKATLTGTVKPFVTGTTVTIQRFVNSRWVSAGATAKLTGKGTFALQVTVKEGSVFRVSVPRVGLKAPTVSVATAVIVNPAISSTSLPDGVQGNPYSAQLTQVGANPGTWSVTPALPAGLSLNTSTGRITGTPTAQQAATPYTFTLAQPGLVTASKVLNLTITAPVPPTITTSSLPDADKNQPYSTTLKAAGDPVGTWTATPLPAGLSLNAGTGVISGTPTAAGSTNVSIGFTQTSTGLAAPGKQLALVVNPPPAPSIRTTSLPNAIQNTAYSTQLEASDGATGTWSVSGSLPLGFSFSTSTGTLSGSTLAVGTYTLTFGFSNADGAADPVTLKLKVVTFAVQANEAIVSAGGSSTCRIDPDRALWCWGYDDSGQLGNGGTLVVDPAAQASPVRVGTANDWNAVSVSDDDLTTEAHACGLRGTVAYCWGDNSHGMLGTGTFNGSETAPVAVGGGQAWSTVSAGWTHTCGVTTSGKLYCWGDNQFSQLGVSGGDKANPTQVGTATDWESVSAGYTGSCAIKSNGTLYCWGANFRGELGVGDKVARTTPTKVGNGTWTQVSVGSGYACGRRTTGTVACWGPSTGGQLGNGVDANSDATDVTTPAAVGAGTSWTSVSTGKSTTCATNLAGEVWCWGSNGQHQVGDGTTTNRTTPVKVGTATTWNGVSVGASHACGVQVSGTQNDTYCWGSNFKGKAGATSGTELATPTQTVG